MSDCKLDKNVVDSFVAQNKKAGLRVFVAGGHRGGTDPVYVAEAYNLGRQIIKMDFKLDFGLFSYQQLQGIDGCLYCYLSPYIGGNNKKQYHHASQSFQPTV